MPHAALGALLGMTFATALAGAGYTSLFGLALGSLWMVGASIGSLFDAPSLDMGGATPNYNFGPLSNTKTQLLPVPICYGRVRVAGNIFLQRFHDDKKEKMDMLVGLSEGPIGRVVSVMANEHVLWGEGQKEVTYWIMEAKSGKDAPPPEWRQVTRTEWEDWEGRKEIRDKDGKKVELDLKECSCDVHLGEPGQAPDPRSIGSLPYDKLAYVAVTLKAQEGLTGNPTIVTVLEGRKVWTPSGTRYTRNPAWIVWDLLTNSDYGVGIPAEHLDQDTFEAVAAVCDQPVGGEPRYTLDYIIDQQRPAIDILRDMLACFRGFFICRERIELHVDREVSAPYKAIGPDQIVMGSLQVWQAAADDVPNRLLIEWVDPDNFHERSTAVFENQADMLRRGVVEKQVSMLGITSAAQVSRMGGYLLSAGQEIREFCSFGLSLQDADIEVGDVVSLSSEWAGYSGKWFRVLSLEDSGDDSIRVTCAEYSSTAYSAAPTPFTRPKPDTPVVNYDDVHNLVLSLDGHVEADGTWFPAIGARWGNPTTWTPESIEVQYRHKDDPENHWTLHAAMPGTAMETLISSGLRTKQTVTVWVRAKGKNGLVSTGQMASIALEKDTIPPGPVTGLAAEGWFGSIWLTWINPPDSDLSHVEIWECDHDVLADAVKVAQVRGTSYQRNLGSFQGRYYWARAVDYSGNVGQWNAQTGVPGYSDQASHDDFVEALLIRNPAILEIQGDLNTGIQRIDGLTAGLSGLTAEVDQVQTTDLPAVRYRLGQIEDVAIPDIDIRLDQVQDVAIPSIHARIDEVREEELPAIRDGLARGLEDSYDAATDAAEGVIRALIDLGDVGQVLRDAGIQVDPRDGKVKIWATEKLREEHQALLTNLSLQLDAQRGLIQQRATYAEVDERIAGAVFGDAWELLLSGVDARINDVQSNLNALDASLESRALQVVASPTGGGLTDVKQRLSAAEGTISNAATKLELQQTATGINTRLTTAESRIDATEGTIGDVVTGLSGVVGNDAALTAEGLVHALMANADQLDGWHGELAVARRELMAHTEAGVSAEAAERVQLAAVVDSHYAEAQHELSVLATKQATEATRTDSLLTRMGGAESAIAQEQTTRATADQAEAQARTTLEARLSGDIQGEAAARAAAIQEESRARAEADSTEAAQRTTLGAQLTDAINGEITERKAAIQTEAQARIAADQAEANARLTLQSRVATAEADIQTESQTRANADSAETQARQTLAATVAGNTAAIQQEAQTRATADQAEASARQALATRVATAEAAIESVRSVTVADNTSTTKQLTEMVSRSGRQTGSALVEEVLGRAADAGRVLEQTAVLRQELVTETRAGQESLARAKTELGARLDEANALVREEAEARATADAAEASRREELVARVSTAEAGLIAETTARTGADSAMAGSISTLQAGINAVEGQLPPIRASVEEERSARVAALEAESQQRTALEARLQEDIQDETTARVAAIEAESQARATADQAEATSRQALAARVDGHDAAIESVRSAASSETGATAGLVTTLVAQAEGRAGSALVEDILGRAEGTIQALRQYGVLRQEMDVSVREGVEALASAKITLGARIDENVAALQEERSARATQDEAVSRMAETLFAQARGDAAAAIQQEAQARATALEAEAAARQQLEATVAGNTAAIQTEAQARATADSAISSSVSTLQTTVGEHTSSIQVVSQSVDGIKSKHGVRVDTNGYVTGYELIGDGTSGSMVFHVDNFLIGKPGTTSDYPFALGTVDGVTRVSLKNAFIQDGAIKSAKIQDLTVGRVKLAGGVTAGLSWGSSTYQNWVYAPGDQGLVVTTDYQYPVSLSVTTGVAEAQDSARSRVLVVAFLRLLTNGGYNYLYLQKNGVHVADMGIITNQSSAQAVFLDDNPGTGSTTYRIRIHGNSPQSGWIWNAGIAATVFFR